MAAATIATSWTSPRRPSTAEGASLVAFTDDSLTVYAVYSLLTTPGTTNYDIWWNTSIFGGTKWPNETLLTLSGMSPDPSLYPSVTYDQQGQHAWAVWREGNGPNWTLKGQRIE